MFCKTVELLFRPKLNYKGGGNWTGFYYDPIKYVDNYMQFLDVPYSPEATERLMKRMNHLLSGYWKNKSWTTVR